MLSKFEYISKLEDAIKFIDEVFEEASQHGYIPALIDQGNLNGNDGKDFYLKLVLKHIDIEINDTWLLGNLYMGLLDPDSEVKHIHNVIVGRNYKGKHVYQINPLITSNESFQEDDVVNGLYVSGYYNDEYSSIKGKQALVIKDGDLYIYTGVLKPYVNARLSNTCPKFEIVAEFEYRNSEAHLNSTDNVFKSERGYIDFTSDKNGVWIRGSINLPYVFEKKENVTSRNIIVFDLGTGNLRKLNENNYTGDMEVGFVVFDKSVINDLKQYYYFYDIEMFDKGNLNNRYLVDYMLDKVVMFEDEYNKLPNSIKDLIDKYNIKEPNKEGIISKAMYTMQLEGSWNWDKELLPDKQLACLVKQYLFERAIDSSVSFLYPESTEELIEFIQKIELLIPGNFESEVKKELFSTVEVKKLQNIDKADLIKHYITYCDEMCKVIKNELG